VVKMPGIAFDQAAEYYDHTRGFREGVAEQIRDAILAYTGATLSTRFLELGVGTGRIALPFILAGYDFTGIDLSQPMMDRLESKLRDEPATPGQPRRYALFQGDVTDLPFAGNSFDVIIAVHVLHLVDGWQKALDEARRVLRRSGFLMLSHEEQKLATIDPETPNVNRQWYKILEDLGVKHAELQPGIRPQWDRANRDSRLVDYLRELGAQVEDVTLLEYSTKPLSPRQLAQRHIDRMYSSDWQLSDEVHAEAVRRFQTWLDESCPEPDKPTSITSYFKTIVATWPQGS
jgi:ubiquinone/menaquinone biosynthesis C-methylase UbiE